MYNKNHIYSTKMCIRFVIYLHQKSAIWALNIVLLGTLVLMMLTKFVPNSTIIRCSSGTIFLKSNKMKYCMIVGYALLVTSYNKLWIKRQKNWLHCNLYYLFKTISLLRNFKWKTNIYIKSYYTDSIIISKQCNIQKKFK